MASFDPKAYEESVVKPLKRRTAGDLPDDLVARYAIDLAMSDGEVVRRLAEIRSHWNKGAQANGKPQSVRSVYKAFLRADEALQRDYGADLGRVVWWRARAKSREGVREAQVTELAEILRAGFGDLGLIATGQLHALLGSAFAALSPDEVERALAEVGVRSASPRELPKSPGIPNAQYRELCRSLVDADLASVPALLHGPLNSFRLLTSFSGDPPAPAGLTGHAVEAAVDRENRRSGNQAARQALGILSSAARSGVDLRELALHHLLDDVREHHRQGVPAVALLRRLAATGLDRDEAREAVFSVLNESGHAPVGGLSAVKALLEEGRLVAARLAVGAMTASDDATAARTLVDRQSAEVRRLREDARAALGAGAEDEARHLLRQAVALAADDEDLTAELRRIPPAPVLGLSANPDGLSVRLAWRPAPSHDGGTRYRLVRREGRVPADPDDGTRVVETTKAVGVDERVPAGRPLGYAVFAGVPGGAWSRAAGATIEFLPPVHDVRLTVGNGVVEGRWRAHPDVLAVEVRRDGGTAVPTAGPTSFRDR
ncbi:hypothetical protein ACFV4N_24860, partial [Actinosynnema sp. NPDC059797]